MINTTRTQKLTAAALTFALTLGTTIIRGADLLPSWNDGKAKQSIMDFVAKITKEGSPDFVPLAALNEEKTKLIPFGKHVRQNGGRAALAFLGFTFYWGRSRHGSVIPKVKTIGKRLRQKRKWVQEWARTMRHRYRLPALWAIFCAKLRGHIHYYGVTFNLGMVRAFVFKATKCLFKWLNRRSQRQSFSWARFRLFMQAHPLPAVQAYHPLYASQ